jgi:hypothetical protein
MWLFVAKLEDGGVGLRCAKPGIGEIVNLGRSDRLRGAKTRPSALAWSFRRLVRIR